MNENIKIQIKNNIDNIENNKIDDVFRIMEIVKIFADSIKEYNLKIEDIESKDISYKVKIVSSYKNFLVEFKNIFNLFYNSLEDRYKKYPNLLDELANIENMTKDLEDKLKSYIEKEAEFNNILKEKVELEGKLKHFQELEKMINEFEQNKPNINEKIENIKKAIESYYDIELILQEIDKLRADTIEKLLLKDSIAKVDILSKNVVDNEIEKEIEALKKQNKKLDELIKERLIEK